MSSEKRRVTRRELLQGKLWKLLKPTRLQPLVMRYPKVLGDVRNAADGAAPVVTPSKPLTVKGISIEPVPTTRLSMGTRPAAIPLFRPPGAIEEQLFLSGCTRCGDCSEACPHKAITNAITKAITKDTGRLGSDAGTPVIVAELQACMMCEDFPCIAACKPRVLSAEIPVVMGTAHVTEHLCVAHHGTTCTVCSERCPVDNAIVVSHGKPRVNEEACTGCGVCRYVCPAPENAILLMPVFSRPLPPSQS